MNQFNDYRPAHLRTGNDHNITRASRKANARWNKPANRRQRRNYIRVLSACIVSLRAS